jgi:rod shape-determining protein MreC
MSGTKNIFNNKKNFFFVKFFIGVVALFLFLGTTNFFNSQIKNFFYSASYPIEKKFWYAGQSTSDFFGAVFKSGNLSKENENLKNENQKLLSQITFLQSIRNANEAQSDVSVACQNRELEFIMAGVIGLDNQDEFTINKGSDDGIEVGMPIINQQNALFGKITEVYKNFSKIMLISNKDSVVNVKILQNKNDDSITEVYGVLKGNGGFEAYLDLVPVDDTILEGEILITSALEGTFPKDLLIGKISGVDKNDQNPHQQARVKLFLDVKTDNLFVISNYKK